MARFDRLDLTQPLSTRFRKRPVILVVPGMVVVDRCSKAGIRCTECPVHFTSIRDTANLWLDFKGLDPEQLPLSGIQPSSPLFERSVK